MPPSPPPTGCRSRALLLERLQLAHGILGAADPDIGLDEIGVPRHDVGELEPVLDLETGAFLEVRRRTLRTAE